MGWGEFGEGGLGNAFGFREYLWALGLRIRYGEGRWGLFIGVGPGAGFGDKETECNGLECERVIGMYLFGGSLNNLLILSNIDLYG